MTLRLISKQQRYIRKYFICAGVSVQYLHARSIGNAETCNLTLCLSLSLLVPVFLCSGAARLGLTAGGSNEQHKTMRALARVAMTIFHRARKTFRVYTQTPIKTAPCQILRRLNM